nr:metallophosphoesterase [Sunxiuqinia sp.]
MLFVITAVFGQKNKGFNHQLSGKKVPWTSEPVISGDNYRFVIIGDLTGGQEPGVFDYAIDRINDLAPDFVITVGDIIEGYSTDSTEIERQWQDFSRTLDRLEAPFFAVPGNHDVTTNLMLELWQQHWGFDYYSFYVGESLFVVLNSTEPGVDGFSDAQVEYVHSVFLTHPVGSSAFVFVHDPFYEMVVKQGYTELNSIFSNHKVTFFCGHEHRYQYREIEKSKHFMLAALASGGAGMRGSTLGEFHNLMQVAVKNDQMKIANIELEGLLPQNIVNSTNIVEVDILRGANWAQIVPTVKNSQIAQQFESILLLENKGNFPLEISSEFQIAAQLSIHPSTIEMVLQPKEISQVPLRLFSELPVNIEDLPEIKLNLNGRFALENEVIDAISEPEWVIDYLRESFHCDEDILPGKWEKPALVEEVWDWDGLTDGSFALNVCHDSQVVSINIRIQDDNLVEADSLNLKGDRMKVFVHPDMAGRGEPTVFEFEHGGQSSKGFGTTRMAKETVTNMEKQAGLLKIVLAIPRKFFLGNSFRMNLAYEDVDIPTNMDHAVIWWKPQWESKNDYAQSGVISLAQSGGD